MQYLKNYGFFTNECVLNVNQDPESKQENVLKFDQWYPIKDNWRKPRILSDHVAFKNGILSLYDKNQYIVMASIPLTIKTNEHFDGILKARMVVDKKTDSDHIMEPEIIATTIQNIHIPPSKISGESILNLQGFINIPRNDLTFRVSLEYLCNNYENVNLVPENITIHIDTHIAPCTWTCIQI